MDKKNHSQKNLRRRKFLLVLPLLVLPFITMIFWSLGGGRGDAALGGGLPANNGLNMQLPEAVFKEDGSLNKMSFYDQAASDSLKRSELMKTDPFFKMGSAQNDHNAVPTDSGSRMDTKLSSLSSFNDGRSSVFTYTVPGIKDANEAKVYSKLEELNKAMNQASMQSAGKSSGSDSYVKPAGSTMNTADVNRLEQMMNVMKNGSDGDDQEMKQLNGMLDKIMDIQHPEKTSETIRQISLSHQSRVLAVNPLVSISRISILASPSSAKNVKKDTTIRGTQTGFFSLDTIVATSEPQNAITAFVHETQNLVSGATVKMRLGTDVYVSGILIPKDNFVYGTAVVNDERLKITIESIRYQNSIFQVRLSVYDMDGMEGIFVPGSISRDVAKSSTDQALQGIGLTSLNSSLPAQAAGAGIQAAKSLLSKKAKLIKVSVKAGYQVLLKDADHN